MVLFDYAILTEHKKHIIKFRILLNSKRKVSNKLKKAEVYKN